VPEPSCVLTSWMKSITVAGRESAGARGRRTEFEALWEAEFTNAFRTAYLLIGDRETAADIAQEAFARAFARWDQVGNMGRPDAWMRQVVHNLAVTWLRRRAIASRILLRSSSGATTATEPSMADDELMTALTRLTPAQRAVVVLRFFDDLSIEEVARITGKRPGTVRALTSQGLARLRKLIDSGGTR